MEAFNEYAREHAELLRTLPMNPDNKIRLAGMIFDVMFEVFQDEDPEIKLDRTAFICACSEQESLF